MSSAYRYRKSHCGSHTLPIRLPHNARACRHRYQALQLLEEVEATRGRAYRAVLIMRPDLLITSSLESLPTPPAIDSIYVVNSDHMPDSDDAHHSDPHERGLCGQMPNDWLAMGE